MYLRNKAADPRTKGRHEKLVLSRTPHLHVLAHCRRSPRYFIAFKLCRRYRQQFQCRAYLACSFHAWGAKPVLHSGNIFKDTSRPKEKDDYTVYCHQWKVRAYRKSERCPECDGRVYTQSSLIAYRPRGIEKSYREETKSYTEVRQRPQTICLIVQLLTNEIDPGTYSRKPRP